jgi:hypothetical protein
MVAFPKVGWFDGFAGALERDEDFRKHGRWFKASIGFRVDQAIVSMTFDRCMVMDVQCGYVETDFLISGSPQQWARLFEDNWGFVRLYRSQTLAVRGDPVRLMKEWKPIFFIVEAMKSFDKSCK